MAQVEVFCCKVVAVFKLFVSSIMYKCWRKQHLYSTIPYRAYFGKYFLQQFPFHNQMKLFYDVVPSVSA